MGPARHVPPEPSELEMEDSSRRDKAVGGTGLAVVSVRAVRLTAGGMPFLIESCSWHDPLLFAGSRSVGLGLSVAKVT